MTHAGCEEPRAQPQRLAECGRGLIVAALSLLHDAEVVTGPRIAGREPQRIAKDNRRIGVAA